MLSEIKYDYVDAVVVMLGEGVGAEAPISMIITCYCSKQIEIDNAWQHSGLLRVKWYLPIHLLFLIAETMGKVSYDSV